MRVALVCPYAWDDPGGVQTQVRELAERLLGGGHEVVVLTPVRRAPVPEHVRIVGRPIDVRYNGSNAPIDPRPWSRIAARRALRAFRPDVVHVHEPFAPSTGLWATLESPAPVVATFHSGAERSRLFDLAAPVLRRVARRITVRIAVSETASSFAGARIGGPFEIVPNGVDVGRFAEAEAVDLGSGRKLLFLGRLDERKGFPTAVDAFARIASRDPDVRLIVVGEGSERDAIGRLDDPIRGRVRMLGAVTNVELPPYVRACDLYLGSAVGGESFGVVLVEAMAAGVPVVASDIPGYREVVRDGVEAILVPPRDAAALADAGGRILGDPDLAARLAAAGRARADAFGWPTVVERIEGLYVRAIEAGPASVR